MARPLAKSDFHCSLVPYFPEKMKQYLKPLSYVLLVHVVALVIMSLFRLVFYLTVAHQLTPDVSGQPLLVATAFLRGVWFDNVIACYITALPLVVVCVVVKALDIPSLECVVWRVLCPCIHGRGRQHPLLQLLHQNA